MRTPLITASALFMLCTTAASAASVTYDGITFPAGDVSFADQLIDLTFGSPAPTDPNYMDGDRALGAPDYSGAIGSVSLGSGGRLTLRFADNSLSGSGTSDSDLHIFEVGPAVEDTFVEISMDGLEFLSVGKVFGSTSSIDIDPFLIDEGIDPFTRFSFVRLTDDPNEGGRSGATVGADIDAVGAISSAPPVVPLPASLPLLAAGLGALFGVRRFRTT